MGKHRSKIGKAAKKQSSILDGQSESRRNPDELFLTFNFKYFRNHDNGEAPMEWEGKALLSSMLDEFRHYSNQKMSKIYCKRFKPYNGWPPPDKTTFKPPKDIPDYKEKNWASMHIRGLECVIGFLYENIFYVFWLDSKHGFWLCDQ